MAVTIVLNDKAISYVPPSASTRPKPDDPKLEELLKYLDERLGNSSPMLYGTIFVDLELVSGASVRLRHRLGRPFTGYTCIRQQGAAFSAFEPTLKTTIASSTNATPIVVTTSVAHNLTSGDRAQISGHLVNTSANGNWNITVTGTTTFSLNGSVGVGVGGATGNAQLIEVDISELLVLRSSATGKFTVWVF